MFAILYPGINASGVKSITKYKTLYTIAERSARGLCCCSRCIGRILDLTDPAVYRNLERYSAQDLIRGRLMDPARGHGKKNYNLTLAGRRRLVFFKTKYSPALGVRS